jgi:hypothetical protein
MLLGAAFFALPPLLLPLLQLTQQNTTLMLCCHLYDVSAPTFPALTLSNAYDDFIFDVIHGHAWRS